MSNNDFRIISDEAYPKKYHDEDDGFIYKDEDIALNKDRIGQATPYMISPQIAAFTKKFGEEYAELPTPEEMPWQIELSKWKNQYQDESWKFVPQNKWVHEVVHPPIHVKDNTYKIPLSADVYLVPTPHHTVIDGVENREVMYKPVTRTLYPYIKVEDESSVPHPGFLPKEYYWIIRWLPKKINAKLRFYTTKEIESDVQIYSPEIVVECDANTEDIKVPVWLRRTIRDEVGAYIKHDTIILYVDLIEE